MNFNFNFQSLCEQSRGEAGAERHRHRPAAVPTAGELRRRLLLKSSKFGKFKTKVLKKEKLNFYNLV
jgi:hypothetical protein